MSYFFAGGHTIIKKKEFFMPDIVCENFPMPVFDVIEDSAPIEVKINLSKDYSNNILSSSGYVVAARGRIEGDHAVFGGKAVFNLIFMGDGATRMESAVRFDFKKALPSGDFQWCEVTYGLSDISHTPSGDGVILSATLSYCIYLYGQVPSPFVKDYGGLKKMGEFTYDRLLRGGGLFDFEEELSFLKIGTVLSSSCTPTVTAVRGAHGAATAEGFLRLDISYRTLVGDEILYEHKKVPFTFEMDCPDCEEGCFLTAHYNLDDLSLTVFTSDDDGPTRVAFKGAVYFSLVGVKRVTEGCVEDCFSTQNILDVTQNTYTYRNFSYQRCEDFKIYAKAICDVPEYSRLIRALSPRAAISSVAVDGGALKIEGIIACDGVFVGDDGLVGRRIELPFSQSVDVPGDGAHVTSLSITDFEARLKGGRVEVDCHLCINYFQWSWGERRLITALQEGEAITKKLSAITVYVAQKGDEEWDVVKATGEDIESILTFNPDITFPLKGEEKIVVLRGGAR